MKSWIVLSGCLLLLAAKPARAQSIDDIQKDIAQAKLEKRLVSQDIKQSKKELSKTKSTTASADSLKKAIAMDKKELNAADREESEDKAKLGQIKDAADNFENLGVSGASVDAFKKDFGNIKEVSWVRGNVSDEATFNHNGQTLTAYYDDSAKLVGTSTRKKMSDLPQKARQQIGKDYKTFIITDVIFFDANTKYSNDDSYFVNLQKDNENDILQVDLNGGIRFYAKQ